jgi:DNA-binding Lrp family transcriptional regulator
VAVRVEAHTWGFREAVVIPPVTDLAAEVGWDDIEIYDEEMEDDEAQDDEAEARSQSKAAKTGRPTLAFVRIRVGGDRRLQHTKALFEALPQVLECHRVTGEDCYILKVAVADNAELEALVDQLFTVGDPITSIVTSTLISHAPSGTSPTR